MVKITQNVGWSKTGNKERLRLLNSQKKLLKHINILCLSLLFFSCTAEHEKIANGPNIVFILADDASWKHFGAYGSNDVKTPHIDKMAQEGVLFQNAFVSTPSCTASRGSILSGRNAFELEDGILLGGYLPKKFITYTSILAKAGYKVAATGKGWGPGTLFGRTVNPAGTPYNDLRSNPYREVLCENPISDIDYAANFNNFLFDRKEDQPFVFWVGTNEPHKPYADGFAAVQNIDSNNIKVPEFYPDNNKVRSELAAYLAEIQHIDLQVGAVYEVLKKHNELENTLVVFTSDNGMPFPRAKSNLYDYGIRIPLIVTWGDQIQKGRRIDDLISLTDLAPTFIDAAGLSVPETMSGKSFMDILKSDQSGMVRKEERSVFSCIERHGRDAIYPSRSIRTKDFHLIWNALPDHNPIVVDGGPIKDVLITYKEKYSYFYKLTIGKRPAYELYEVKKDPYSMNNLTESSAHQIILEDLKSELIKYLKIRQDPRIIGTHDLWHYSPHFILWNGDKGSGVNYSPFAQGQNIPTPRMKKMLIDFYQKNDFEAQYIERVMQRLEQNLE